MKRFYDSIQPNLSNPVAVLKIIGNFEKELQNNNNYLKVEKEQLESVMSIDKSSVQYWSYGNGSFKATLATEYELPAWASHDIAGAASSVADLSAEEGAAIAGPWGFFGVMLGTAAIASMI